jgi:hypothetical protein
MSKSRVDSSTKLAMVQISVAFGKGKVFSCLFTALDRFLVLVNEYRGHDFCFCFDAW